MSQSAEITIDGKTYEIWLHKLTLETLQSKIINIISLDQNYCNIIIHSNNNNNNNNNNNKSWNIHITDSDNCIVDTDELVQDAFENNDHVHFTVQFLKENDAEGENLEVVEISESSIKTAPLPISELQLIELYPDKCTLTWNHNRSYNCMYFVITEQDSQCRCATVETMAKITDLQSDTTYTFHVLAVYYDPQQQSQLQSQSQSQQQNHTLPTLDIFPENIRSKSLSLKIHTPSTDAVKQQLSNSFVSVDSNTFRWEYGEGDNLILHWASPQTFCGKISYDLLDRQNQHIGRVFKLPCTLKVQKFTGHGKLQLSIQTVVDTLDHESIKSESLPVVFVDFQKDTQTQQTEIDEVKEKN